MNPAHEPTRRSELYFDCSNVLPASYDGGESVGNVVETSGSRANLEQEPRTREEGVSRRREEMKLNLSQVSSAFFISSPAFEQQLLCGSINMRL